jgi:hypothetical protein
MQIKVETGFGYFINNKGKVISKVQYPKGDHKVNIPGAKEYLEVGDVEELTNIKLSNLLQPQDCENELFAWINDLPESEQIIIDRKTAIILRCFDRYKRSGKQNLILLIDSLLAKDLILQITYDEFVAIMNKHGGDL